MRTLLVICLLVTIATPVSAQGEGAERPLASSAFWLARLGTQFRSGQVHEMITITVEQGSQRATEVIEFASQPVRGFREPEVGVDLGEIELWTRPPGDDEEGAGVVRLAHELDWDSFVEIEPVEGESTRDAMRRALPPLMLPHLALAMGGPLFPELGVIEWTDVRESVAIGDSQTITLTGETPSTKVAMTIETGLVTRITAVEITGKRREVRIALSCNAKEPFEGRIGYAVEGRERLDGIDKLRARPGDLGAGDPLPDMALSFFGFSDDHPPSASYEKRLMLFFDGLKTEDGLEDPAGIGYDALLRVEERIGPSARVDPIAVVEPFNLPRDIQNIQVDTYEALGDTPYLYSSSVKHSLRRFAADEPACIVVADSDGRIAGTIPLGDEITERVEKEGRAAVVSSLAAQVRELCSFIDRRTNP